MIPPRGPARLAWLAWPGPEALAERQAFLAAQDPQARRQLAEALLQEGVVGWLPGPLLEAFAPPDRRRLDGRLLWVSRLVPRLDALSAEVAELLPPGQAVLWKGPALRDQLGLPEQRPASDVDVLALPVETVRKRLISIGFRSRGLAGGAEVLARPDPEVGSLVVDLHHRPAPSCFPVDICQVLGRSTHTATGLPVPNVDDHVALLLIHLLQSGFASARHRICAARALGRVDPQRLADRAIAWKAAAVAWTAAAVLEASLPWLPLADLRRALEPGVDAAMRARSAAWRVSLLGLGDHAVPAVAPPLAWLALLLHAETSAWPRLLAHGARRGEDRLRQAWRAVAEEQGPTGSQ